jgi:hypothetical protein
MVSRIEDHSGGATVHFGDGSTVGLDPSQYRRFLADPTGVFPLRSIDAPERTLRVSAALAQLDDHSPFDHVRLNDGEAVALLDYIGVLERRVAAYECETKPEGE